MRLLRLGFSAILMLMALVPFVSASVTVPTNVYFGLPNYGTYVNFSSQQTFDTVYRVSSYWHFNGYKFQIQNSNMTITKLFVDYLLEFTTDSNSLIKVNPSSEGLNYDPKSVSHVGAGVLTYSWSGGELTITNSASATYTIDWSVTQVTGGAGFAGGGAVYTPEKIDTSITILPIYSNLTVVANNQTKIEGQLKSEYVAPVVNATIHLSTSWGVADQTQTGNDGRFAFDFVSPKYNGEYEFKLSYNGDDTYNPSSYGASLRVVGGGERPVFEVSIPLLVIAAAIVVFTASFALKGWAEEHL